MPKPVVNYKPRKDEQFICVDKSAYVFPINHYATDRVSNTKGVITSKVIWYDDVSGEFETLNTRYVPQ